MANSFLLFNNWLGSSLLSPIIFASSKPNKSSIKSLLLTSAFLVFLSADFSIGGTIECASK